MTALQRLEIHFPDLLLDAFQPSGHWFLSDHGRCLPSLCTHLCVCKQWLADFEDGVLRAGYMQLRSLHLLDVQMGFKVTLSRWTDDQKPLLNEEDHAQVREETCRKNRC